MEQYLTELGRLKFLSAEGSWFSNLAKTLITEAERRRQWENKVEDKLYQITGETL